MKKIIFASTSYEDMMNYPLYQEINRICTKYGYTASEVTMSYKLTIDVYPIDIGSYSPEVYLDEGTYKIQTSSFGSLTPDEFDKFIQANQNAQNMCEEILDAINRIGINESTIMYM